MKCLRCNKEMEFGERLRLNHEKQNFFSFYTFGAIVDLYTCECGYLELREPTYFTEKKQEAGSCHIGE